VEILGFQKYSPRCGDRVLPVVFTVSLEIKEGRKHIVRKLCTANRLKLIHLHRSQIGGLTLNCGQ
jgi:16S rRNA U516 pseudouridylate synthase RsuA-like enzyme